MPERAGAGANHYPMAAEALCALGLPGAIAPEWTSGAAGYDLIMFGIASLGSRGARRS